MLLSKLYAITDTAGATENLVVSAAVAMESDVFDYGAANIADGGGELFLNLYCTAKHATLAANIDIDIIIEESAAGTDFQTLIQKKVNTTVGDTAHDLLAVGEILKVPLRVGTKRYLRITATPAATITNTVTFKAFISTT